MEDSKVKATPTPLATDVEAVARRYADDFFGEGLPGRENGQHEDLVDYCADLLRAERRAVVRLVRREYRYWDKIRCHNQTRLGAQNAMDKIQAALAARDGRTGEK